MYAKMMVSAAVALGMVTGALAVTCDDTTVLIQNQQDATTIAACSEVGGSVTIAPGSGNSISLDGKLNKIGGNFEIKHNGQLLSLSSNSLATIGGSWIMFNVTKLASLDFTSLRSVDKIDWQTLNALPAPNFGTTGITKASSIKIADTFLNTLVGINVASMSDFTVIQNVRLTNFTTQLGNLTGTFECTSNGQKLNLAMPSLNWASTLKIANVTTFSAPELTAINTSMYLDSNYFDTVHFPKLKTVNKGDISFINNPEVTNISFPVLTKIGGGLTIANNTGLMKLDGFPALTDIGGAVKMRGSFSEAALPKLENVVGAFDLSSTQDISKSCEVFDKQQRKTGGQIQGDYHCTSENANANNDTNSIGGTTGGRGSGSGSGGTNASAASPMSASMSAVAGLAGLAALVSAFL